MLAAVCIAALIDLALAVLFTLVPLPEGRLGMAVHSATLLCEAIIIPITVVLLRYNLDTSFSTKTVYLILSGVFTVTNFVFQIRQLRRSTHLYTLSGSKSAIAPSASVIGTDLSV